MTTTNENNESPTTDERVHEQLSKPFSMETLRNLYLSRGNFQKGYRAAWALQDRVNGPAYRSMISDLVASAEQLMGLVGVAESPSREDATKQLVCGMRAGRKMQPQDVINPTRFMHETEAFGHLEMARVAFDALMYPGPKVEGYQATKAGLLTNLTLGTNILLAAKLLMLAHGMPGIEYLDELMEESVIALHEHLHALLEALHPQEFAVDPGVA